MLPRAAFTAELAYLRGSGPVHFRFDAGRLHLSTDAAAQRLSTSLEAAGAGEAWLSVDVLYEWLRLVSDAEVGLRFTASAAVFSHATGAVKIPTLVVRPPELTPSPMLSEIRLPSRVAETMVRSIAMAQTRGYHAYIDGVLFETKDNTLSIGASNGVMVGVADVAQPGPDVRTVLGESAVAQMIRTIRDGASDLIVRLHERGVSFLCGARETTVPSACGSRFPPFRKFLPKGAFRLDARTDDIRAALTAVVTPAKDVCAVCFDMYGGDVRLQIEQSSASVSCFGALPAIKVAAANLLAILKAIETDRVEFTCDGPTAPLAIRPIGQMTTYLMVPVVK